MRRGFAIALLVCAPWIGGTGPEAVADQECLKIPTFDDRCEAWVASYDNPEGHGASGGMDRVFAVAASSELVFVTGMSWSDAEGRVDILTAAYRADTGTEAWTARFNGSAAGASAHPYALAVSPDGSRLFVTGVQQISFDPTLGGYDDDGADAVTLAYDARDGRLVWAAPYVGAWTDVTLGVTVAPDGSGVFVTGWTRREEADGADALTLAYDAATGQEAWRAFYDGGGGLSKVIDYFRAVRVSPDGEEIYVAGTRNANNWYSEMVTLAYGASDGGERWVSSYIEPAARNEGMDLALSPDGKAVFTTGRSNPGGSGLDGWEYATVANDAVTGARRWVARYEGYDSTPRAVAADAERVYVTGSSEDESTRQYALVTAAYDAVTGGSAWTARNPLPAVHGLGISEYSAGLAVAGGRVYAAGFGRLCTELPPPAPSTTCGGIDYLANAYDASNGKPVWNARYNSATTGLDRDLAAGAALSPDGRRFYVAGTFIVGDDDPGPGTNRYRYGTVAYDL